MADYSQNGIVELGPPLRDVPFKIKLISSIAVKILSFVGRTWKVEWVGKEIIDELDKNGVIFAFWHGKSLVPCWTYKDKGVVVMVSLHRDGEIMNRALAALGFKRVRGSSTKGGRRALNAMCNLLNQGYSVAVTPDGPRGPKHSVHPGVFMLASKTGKPILPCGIGAKSYWELATWDSFLIPKPFTKVKIVGRDPMYVPKELSRELIKELEADLKNRLFNLTKEAEKF